MPAGTAAKILYPGKAVPPAWDETLTGATCNTSPDANLIGLNKQGRWQNVLLGQTLTLALNIRFDAYHEGGLADLSLCKYMTSLKANVVVDSGGNVTEEPATLCKANISSRVIPEAVLAELNDSGGATVANLLALANKALAGQPTDSTLDEINQAVSAVNELFDECRYLIYCDSDNPFDIDAVPDCPVAFNTAPGNGATQQSTAGNSLSSFSTNPFDNSPTLRSVIMREIMLSNIFRRDGNTAGNS
jgi:hypothetical protein